MAEMGRPSAAEVIEDIASICVRDRENIGSCDYPQEVADEASEAIRAGDRAAVEAQVAVARDRVSRYCWGDLISQGCFAAPLCPASPNGQAAARLRSIGG